MNVYTAKEAVFPGGYHWKFTTRFRLNKAGVIDSYYDDLLDGCLFWLEMNAKGKWELRGTEFFFDDLTDATFFRLNFDDVIRHITESADHAARKVEPLMEDDEEDFDTPGAIVVEVEKADDVTIINGHSDDW